MKLTHDQLILEYCRQADKDRFMIWKEPTLGARKDIVAKPDILMMPKSWSSYEVRIIEVKVNQSDLDQDVKKLKFEKYFPWAHRVSFLVGEDLDDTCLIRHPVGIIRHKKGSFVHRRAAPLLNKTHTADYTRDYEMFHALNMGESRFQSNMRIDRVREAHEWLELANHKLKWDEKYKIKSKELRDLCLKAQDLTQDIETRKKAIMNNYEKELRQKFGVSPWDKIDSVNDILKAQFNDSVNDMVADLKKKMEKLRTELGITE